MLICRSFVTNAAEGAFEAMPTFTMDILTGYCKARMLFESGMEVAA